MENKKYVICIYVRLSSEDDDLRFSSAKKESNSITAQREIIHNYIKNNQEFADSIVIEKCDDGFSGTHFDNRPQFQEMIELAKKGEIDCIIVKDFSRFGRDYIELGDYMEQLLPFLGIRFISVNDNYDSAQLKLGEMGGLDISFKNLVYDYYARETSKKEKMAWRKSAEKGEYRASSTLYGYKKSPDNKYKLVIDPEAAEVVKEIFTMSASGIANVEIAKNLNSRKIPVPKEYKWQHGDKRTINKMERKGRWDSSSIFQILSNEIYTGNMVLLKNTVDRYTGKETARPKEEWVRVENTHEAIISKDIFEYVNSNRRKVNRTASGKRNVYYCSMCGRKMAYYQNSRMICKNYTLLSGEERCIATNIKGPDADKLILEDIKAKISIFVGEQNIKLPDDENADIGVESLNKSLQLLDAEWKNMYSDYADRRIGKEEYLNFREIYNQKKEQLEKKIALAEEKQQNLTNEEKNRSSAKTLYSSFLEEEYLTENMKNLFIEKIMVHPDNRFEIIWKFDVQKYFGYSRQLEMEG